MKYLVIALTLLCAGAAVAGSIYDVQTGGYTIGDEVVIDDGIVTGVRDNGVFVSEPTSGPYTGVWVFTGSDPLVAVGDLVDVKGLYEEYFDLTEINVTTDLTGYFTYVGPHMGTLVADDVTTTELNADPEAWECCFVQLTNGMVVTDISLGFNEWLVESYEAPGQFMRMDDYWYDFASVQVGHCYDCAVGIWVYGFGNWKLQPHEGNICVVDCTVANESLSFGQVKSLYR